MIDLLVVGSGVAGLSAAIRAARSGARVVVVTKGALAQSATRYAQGGVAAALEAPDSAELHLSDTLAAGAGLCDPEAVRVLTVEGPGRVRELMELGATFDRAGGALALAREGGHSLARVVHAGGDATGAEIERALAVAVQERADVRERCFTLDLIVEGGRCAGVSVVDPVRRDAVALRARHTVLASGGAGQLFAVTTNPTVSTGDGIAMALRSGVAVADVEFVQFHPTALDHPSMPRPLLSEALRGEGAVMRDDDGVAFMMLEHPLGDLAPRDVVARAITRRLRDHALDHLWLDATGIEGFARRFPTIARACRGVGLDPVRDWLPVAPAAHYLCGGIVTDLEGATTLPGLWACGEVADAGVHGANRLASNSLLDGLVFGYRVISAIERGKDVPEETGALRGVLGAVPDPHPHTTRAEPGRPPDATTAAGLRDSLQKRMTLDAGVLRDADSLRGAATELAQLDDRAARLPRVDPAACEVRNLAAVGRALVVAAMAREESRGTHTREDFLESSAAFLGRLVHTGTADPWFVPLTVPVRDRA